jgi:hypothetical protein
LGIRFLPKFWCRLQDLNLRPPDYKSGDLCRTSPVSMCAV